MILSREILRRFSRELYLSGGLSFGSYRLRSGRVSPYYIDLRISISRPSLLKLSTELLMETMSRIESRPTKICGIPMSGAILASALSVVSGLAGLYIRKEPMIYRELAERIEILEKRCPESVREILGEVRSKAHGISRMVDGILEDGDRVLLVDDVITTGATKLEAIEIVREEARRRGLRVDIVGVLVLIDREEGGSRELAMKGYRVYSASSIREIVGALYEEGLIDRSRLEAIESYIEAVSHEGKTSTG